MQTKLLTTRRNLTDDLAATLRAFVGGVQWGPDAYLPAERELGQRYKVSRVTVRRSLARLVAEGLLEPVPSKGYRVRPRSSAHSPVQTVAYVLAQAGPHERWDSTHAQILNAFQQAHVGASGTLLAVGCKGRPAAEVFRELAEARVQAVLLDGSELPLIRAAQQSGLPFVVVDAHSTEPGVDMVIQDNVDGVRLGAAYAVAQGHTRIGWVGPTRGFAHWRERFAGARAGLNDAGLDFDPRHLAITASNEDAEGAARQVRVMVGAADRPTALICPWVAMTLGAADGIRQAGLKVGKDVELVGWANAHEYRETLAAAFLGGDVPATLVWKPSEMARLALSRLRERRVQPDGPACRIDVRVSLIQPQAAEAAVRRGWDGSA